MAKLSVRLPNYTFIFLLILLVYSGYICGTTGTEMAEAQLCTRRSQTSIGFCTSTLLCDRRCREMEGALNGACLRQVLSYACFCYGRKWWKHKFARGEVRDRLIIVRAVSFATDVAGNWKVP
ncbi:hypothetical protein GQ457_03G030510 [Hibiscus cannabinus]